MIYTNNATCNMNTDRITAILQGKGVKPTAIRILIYRTMAGFHTAFSLADLETALETVDKSTISRTINLFKSICILHGIDDGSGSVKYALCRDDCHCGPEDMHLHFHCTRCNFTYCLKDTPVPEIVLPAGFSLESGNFVVKGICAACSELAT